MACGAPQELCKQENAEDLMVEPSNTYQEKELAIKDHVSNGAELCEQHGNP
jgi:hypothetical protein